MILGFEFGVLELCFVLDRICFVDVGLMIEVLVSMVDVYNDGVWIVEISVGNCRFDLKFFGDISVLEGLWI